MGWVAGSRIQYINVVEDVNNSLFIAQTMCMLALLLRLVLCVHGSCKTNKMRKWRFNFMKAIRCFSSCCRGEIVVTYLPDSYRTKRHGVDEEIQEEPYEIKRYTKSRVDRKILQYRSGTG